MALPLLPYAAIIMLGGVLCVGMSGYAILRLKRVPGGPYFLAGTLLAALFHFAYIMELNADSIQSIMLWIRVEYVAIPYIPVFTLLMCGEYFGVRLRRVWRVVLLAFPAVTILLHWTNEAHHLFYASASLQEDVPFPIAKLEYGPYFYVHSLFMYSCYFLCVFVMMKQHRKVMRRYRAQMALLGAGLTMPMVASFLYVGGLSPYGIDLAAVFLSLSFVCYSIALVRYKMLDVAPIPRDVVVESMHQGILVLAEDRTLISCNAAMRGVAAALQPGAVGQSLEALLGEAGRLLAEFADEGKDGIVSLGAGEARKHYKIRVTTVVTRGKMARMLTFVDVTETARREEKLRQAASQAAGGRSD